jgi:hypothetical protein
MSVGMEWGRYDTNNGNEGRILAWRNEEVGQLWTVFVFFHRQLTSSTSSTKCSFGWTKPANIPTNETVTRARQTTGVTNECSFRSCKLRSKQSGALFVFHNLSSLLFRSSSFYFKVSYFCILCTNSLNLRLFYFRNWLSSSFNNAQNARNTLMLVFVFYTKNYCVFFWRAGVWGGEL